MRGVGTPLDHQMRVLSEEHTEELLRVYREHNDSFHDDLIKEYDGVRATLDELSAAGMPMGVVTSKRRCVALRGIDLFDLGGYFDHITCADDVERHKPDPLPLVSTLEAMEVSPANAVYLGDTPYDIDAANAAGMVSVAATWGVFNRDELVRYSPRHVIDSVSELPSLVL